MCQPREAFGTYFFEYIDNPKEPNETSLVRLYISLKYISLKYISFLGSADFLENL